MAVKIKLKRMGAIRDPYYRIVVADSRTKRDGRAIEEIGIYHPKEDPSVIQVNSDRVQHWLSVGAQPTEPVQHLLTITGDWQRFKGEPGAEGTLQVAESKADKKIRYEELAKESLATKEAKSATRPARSSARPKKEVVAEAPAAQAPGSGSTAAGSTAAGSTAEAPAAEAPATGAAAGDGGSEA